jgi:hypothetical protein
MVGGRRQISHGGEVSGYTSRNEIYPDDHVAIVVLTNLDATGASSQIAGRIANTLFATTDADALKALAEVKTIFAGLQHGAISRELFSENAQAYFSKDALADFQTSLGPLGAPTEFVQTGQSLRGGMVFRGYRIRAGRKTMNLTTFWLPNNRLEQYQIEAAE